MSNNANLSYDAVQQASPDDFFLTDSLPPTATGNKILLSDVAQVPIPSTLLLMGTGLIGFVGIRRRSGK